MAFQWSHIKCTQWTRKFSKLSWEAPCRDVDEPITGSQDGPGTAPHQQEAPGGVTALTLTCQSTELRHKKGRLYNVGRNAESPDTPSRMPAREHMHNKSGTTHQKSWTRAQTEESQQKKQLIALEILGKSVRQTLLKSCLYKRAP